MKDLIILVADKSMESALRELLRWPHQQSIREWLSERSFAFGADGKPLRPKEAPHTI